MSKSEISTWLLASPCCLHPIVDEILAIEHRIYDSRKHLFLTSSIRISHNGSCMFAASYTGPAYESLGTPVIAPPCKLIVITSHFTGHYRSTRSVVVRFLSEAVMLYTKASPNPMPRTASEAKRTTEVCVVCQMQEQFVESVMPV